MSWKHLAFKPPLFNFRCSGVKSFSARARSFSTDGNQTKPAFPSESDVVVVGGGVIGTSTAWHLGKLMANRNSSILLLESEKLTSGTTWHSAAMLNTIRGSVTESALTEHTKYLVSEVLERETGVSPGYIQHGGLTATANPDRLAEYKRWISLCGYTRNPSRLVSPEEMQKIYPQLRVDDLLGGIYTETDGSIDPTGLTMAFSKGARDHGVIVQENCPASKILVENGKVVGVETPKGVVRTKKVVLATGAWSTPLAADIGVVLPIIANKHSYIVTEVIPNLGVVPNFREPDCDTYAKVQNQTLFLGGFESNPIFWDPQPYAFSLFELNMDDFLPILNALNHRLPMLETVGYRAKICGPETFTADKNPMFGETPEVQGLFLNCALNSRGIQLSGGMGRAMAELIVQGHTSLDMHMYDIKRFHLKQRKNARWIKERVHESHIKTYHVGFPNDQRLGGRNQFMSPIHTLLCRKGAFFGELGGWERPMFFLNSVGGEVKEYDWYGQYGHKAHDDYPYKRVLKEDYAKWNYSQEISQQITTESLICRSKMAVFDMSSFGKLKVTGSNALSLLEYVCTANMDKEVGSCTFTLILNKEGGVEADIVVCREAKDQFYIVTGAAAIQHVLTILQVHAAKRSCVEVDDVTWKAGIISVQGPQSKQYLEQIVPSLANLEFSKMMPTIINGVTVKILRYTYVGELGYELHIPWDQCESIMAVIDPNYELQFAGMEALSDMAVETGYRHWPADIQSIDSPLQADMAWICHKLNASDMDFIGKEALLREQNTGVVKHFLRLSIDMSGPLKGNETILFDGEVVGYVRRMGTSHSLRRNIAHGYCERSSLPVAGPGARGWEIDIGGQLYPAEVHRTELCDPQNARLY